MKRRFIFLLYCLLVATNIYPDGLNYSFSTIDIDKGLSYSYVTSIHLDSKGALWIGTAFGLNCYDRHELRSYFYKEEDPTSIPGNYIQFVTEAPSNTLWVSTSNGLARYETNKNRFVPAATGKRIDVYTFLATDKEIWFGGEGQLYRYDYQTRTFKELALKDKSRIPSRIVKIYSLKKEVLLLITRDSGIWEYDCSNGELRPSVYPSTPHNITAAHMDDKGVLYLSVYDQGIRIFESDGKQSAHLTTANSKLSYNLILDMIDKDGQLWLATDGGGISLMDTEPPFAISSIRHTPGGMNSLPGNSIGCLYKDKQQNIWVGSLRAGASLIKETFIQTYKEAIPGNQNGLTNKTVNCLCKDQQEFIWVGTDGGGINRFNPKDQTFKHYPTTYNEKVVSAVEYSPSELLLSLYNNGVYRFDKVTGKCTPFVIVDEQTNQQESYSGYIERLYRVSDERFLLLARTPYIYHQPTGKFTVLKTREDPALLSSLQLIDVDGDTAYLQQGNYLLSLNLQTDSLSVLFANRDRETVQVAERDANGIFWIGTNRGLRRLDPVTKKYEKIQTNLFDQVSAVIVENGTLWIGAHNALFSYNVASQKFAIWQESDGYLPNELSNIYYTSSSDSYLYIGGNHGLVRIKKSIDPVGGLVPKIQLTDVVLDGFSYRESGQKKTSEQYLSVPWDYRSLQVKITSVEEDIFKKRLFRYTVFGHTARGDEPKVIETYSPMLNLDMLAPGEYTVLVSCYTDTGDWSASQQLLQLVVTPPWYKDNRILLPIAIGLLALLVWRISVFIRRRDEKMKWKMNEIVQQTNQEKIEFLINISHELRTPLTLIHAPLKKVIEKVDSESVRPEEWKSIQKQLTSIHKSANQMKDIINMTLDVHRISDEENILHKCPHALNEWIYSVAEEFKYELESKQITLVYALNEGIGAVEFDDHKCESVLSNMLMNALKFAPEGSRITITSALTAQNVRISVSDQGIGLQNLDPQKLFTRFYQGEHNQGGSGIGLSYAKTLIKKHGGTIGAFNNPDRGATFYFELPLTDGASLTLHAPTDREVLTSQSPLISFPSPEEEVITAENFPTKAYSIVIVEDNDELRHFLVESLQESFHTVYPAVNGQEAWEIITARMPDIVISDVMMPLMDGYELCRKIKTDRLSSHIPVILLTARADKDSTATGYKLGADAYLPKPFELDFLLVMLHNLLRNREMLKIRYRETLLKVTDDALPKTITNTDEDFLLRFNKLVLNNLSSKELSVQFLIDQIGMSRTPLYAKLKALTNMGVNDYINRLRIEKASELLQGAPNLTITEVSEEVGFEYQRYFSTLFKQVKGVTPTQFRQQQKLH